MQRDFRPTGASYFIQIRNDKWLEVEVVVTKPARNSTRLYISTYTKYDKHQSVYEHYLALTQNSIRSSYGSDTVHNVSFACVLSL